MKSPGIERLEFEYHNSSSNSAAYLLLHGIRGGIHESYTQALCNKLRSRDGTVLAINFPYMSRGEAREGKSTLDEELDALQMAYIFLKSMSKTPVHIIGKSFGGIVASHWLSQHTDVEDVDLSIMGYVPGEGNVLANALRDYLRVVVQGDHDKYGSPDQVRAELAAHQIKADVIEITDADHSYRDINSDNQLEYAFQDQAIDKLMKII